MEKDSLVSQIAGIVGEGNVKVNEPMKNHTTFRIGGPADILVSPDDIQKLSKLIKLCNINSVPFFIMGNGSNLIVRDKGIRGVVIKLYENFNRCEVRDYTMIAQAGILLSRVSKIALEHSLTGLEFAEGIPGTLGGAVYMNAGAYTGEMKDIVVRTECMDRNGDLVLLEGEQHQFAYRSSRIQKEGYIVLSTEMKLKKGDCEEIKAAMVDFSQRRKDKQPLELPSAGSVFKRPAGHFTGKLVDDCGLRGYSVGGAQVSTKHSGFIVNTGNATAEDVFKLIHHVQHTVEEKFGVKLETEVRVVGEE